MITRSKKRAERDDPQGGRGGSETPAAPSTAADAITGVNPAPAPSNQPLRSDTPSGSQGVATGARRGRYIQRRPGETIEAFEERKENRAVHTERQRLRRKRQRDERDAALQAEREAAEAEGRQFNIVVRPNSVKKRIPRSQYMQRRPDETIEAFEARREDRNAQTERQRARRKRQRDERDAALLAERAAAEAEGRPVSPSARKLFRAAEERSELINKLNDCESRITRSAAERDTELLRCKFCSGGSSWANKCRGGDGCIECEARGLPCTRAEKLATGKRRQKQIDGDEGWDPDLNKCRQCRSRDCPCVMGDGPPGPCEQCKEDGLPCVIAPLPVRRCNACGWEHKCIECATNFLRCDGQIPCLVCLRKRIPCVGLKLDGSCPDQAMSTYGTGLPPPIKRQNVYRRGGRKQHKSEDLTAAANLPSTPQPREPPELGWDNPIHADNFGYNRLQACSWCVVDKNRTCDNREPCYECLRQGITEPDDCRTARPCRLCEELALTCDNGQPCQRCLHMGVGPTDCRPVAPPVQQHPNQVPAVDYSCAFCVERGLGGCDPNETPCRTCKGFGRSGDQCRYEQRCRRCEELDLQCDGKMPCSMCSISGIMAQVECLGRGDRSIPEPNYLTRGDLDYPMAEADDYPPSGEYEHEGEMHPYLTYEPIVPDVEDQIDPALLNYPLPSGHEYGGNSYPHFANDVNKLIVPVIETYINPAVLTLPIRVRSQVAHQSHMHQPPQAGQLRLEPPGGFFPEPAHISEPYLDHIRPREDLDPDTGRFVPTKEHISWGPHTDDFRCKEIVWGGPCHELPAMDCDGGEAHGDEGLCICAVCRDTAEEKTQVIMEELERYKNLFCCAECSQAQATKYEIGENLRNEDEWSDNYCECDMKMKGWLCFDCRDNAIKTIWKRVDKTRMQLTRMVDGAILCPRCGVEPGDRAAAEAVAMGLARCSSCWLWIRNAR